MKSPFYIQQEFLSPKQCEEFLSSFEVKTPNTDIDGLPIKFERTLPDKEQQFLMSKLREHIPAIEQRYDATYKATEALTLVHYPENEKKPAELPGCANAQFFRRKWIKNKDIDLTGVIWLKEFQGQVPLDPRHEVYGTKLEFPAYDLSLVPQRGTLVIFPGGPHFITAVSPALVSDGYVIKVNISISAKNGGLWIYDPSKFPAGKNGFIEGWFSEFL